MRPVLSIESLSIGYPTRDGTVLAVREVSFAIQPGEAYGLIGESGSGKSTIAYAVMRYLNGGTIDGGRIVFDGADLARATESELSTLRGNRLAMVYQEPAAALNPSMRVGDQVAEAVRRHRGGGWREARTEAGRLFAQVDLPSPDLLLRRYPHQLSGGQQQRVVIAMALACRPALLIMDEPTTGLDVTTEAVILDLIATLRREFASAILFISHNIAVVSQVCDRIGVLYAGRLVEEGAVQALLDSPAHPYTRGLLDCLPQPGAGRAPLSPIPGSLPDPRSPPPGCVFAARCGFAEPTCRETPPPMRSRAEGRRHLCHFDLDLPGAEPGAEATQRAAPPRCGTPRLTVDSLSKSYGQAGFLFSARHVVRAVDAVSLDVQSGETLAVVGESGSGKSTLARLVMGLTIGDAGSMSFEGAPLARDVARRSRALQQRLQIVFQNPDGALNPQQTVAAAVGRPLAQQGIHGAAQRARVLALLDSVKLTPRHAERYPRELSGGEKQRACIARAFAAEPLMVVCDEPTSALDISVQAAILNELAALQRAHGTSYVFISHDLAVVRYIADRVAVMYRGRIVELGPTEAVFAPPHHPYAEALIAAIPRVRGRPRHIALPPPAPGWTAGTGCAFADRCPRRRAACSEPPPAQSLPDGRVILCHIPAAELAAAQAR